MQNISLKTLLKTETTANQFTATNGLNSSTVWCILEDKSGNIWIGTNAGVCLYDGKKFDKIQIALPNNTPNNKYDVWSIMQDKSGKLWFATTDGVYCYDGKSFTSFAAYEGVSGFMGNNVEYILEDKKGKFGLADELTKVYFVTMENL